MSVNKQKAKSIALVPIGQVDESILAVIGEGLREVFGLDYVIAAPLPHPNYAGDRRRGQHRSDDILARLRRFKLPAEGWPGVVDVDLYTPGLNFVFGQATMGGPAALISLARLRQSFYGLPKDEALYHERAIKEAVHELGHCRDTRCVVSFSNSLRDVDRKSRDFCSSCRWKLAYPLCYPDSLAVSSRRRRKYLVRGSSEMIDKYEGFSGGRGICFGRRSDAEEDIRYHNDFGCAAGLVHLASTKCS